TDLVRGEVTFDHAHVPDFVLARADGAPLYTLAVAVDDVLMEITHVVRGDDLLSSTPRQIAVYRAMGVTADRVPVFAHLPFVLEPGDCAARSTPFLVRAERVADRPAAGDAKLIAAAGPLIQPRIGKRSEAVGMLACLFADGAGFKLDPDDAAKVLTQASAEVL